jgi:predicted RNA-binding Zn ribbon-like protein
MTEKSFWEKLGRGVAQGWQKTKELGSQLSDQIEGKQALEHAREALNEQYRALGKLAADELVATENQSFGPESPRARELLQAILKLREEVERLEKERQEQERQERERAEAEARAQTETETQTQTQEQATDEQGSRAEDPPRRPDSP